MGFIDGPKKCILVAARQVYAEGLVLGYTLSPRTRANPMNFGEWAASMVLFLTWGVISAGIAFGMAEAPPLYHVISGVVILVFGRMWGINLAHQAVGLSPHPDDNRPDSWSNRDGDDED